jgi:hypothetical protein
MSTKNNTPDIELEMANSEEIVSMPKFYAFWTFDAPGAPDQPTKGVLKEAQWASIAACYGYEWAVEVSARRAGISYISCGNGRMVATKITNMEAFLKFIEAEERKMREEWEK